MNASLVLFCLLDEKMLAFLICLSFCCSSGNANLCPEDGKLSGLDYIRTSATVRTSSDWLKKHDLNKLQFLPTIQPKLKGVFPPSHSRIERETKEKKAYANAHITNDRDYAIRHKLDLLDSMVKTSPKKAFNRFKKIYEDSEKVSPRALHGMAVALNQLALTTSDPNEAGKLQAKATEKFCKVMKMTNVPLFLFMSSGRTCLELRRHRKEAGELIAALKVMKTQFPNAYQYASELAFEYLKRRQYSLAVDEFKAAVKRWPQKAEKERILLGIALQLKLQAFPKSQIDDQDLLILSTKLKSYQVPAVSLAIKTLADFYADSGFNLEASLVQEKGANIGAFPSRWQRQVLDNNFYLHGLESRPVWTMDQLPVNVRDQLRSVANHWQLIRKEGLKALFGAEEDFESKATELRQEGQWQQLVLFEKGHKNENGCLLAPKTCKLIENLMSDTAVSCTRGQVKFSVMHSGSHVQPHSGPTNTRLRAHLGLLVPKKGKVEMQIGGQTVRWSEGKIFVIDDSFEHQVWQNGDTIRLVLLIDFWHPDVTPWQRQKLPPLPMTDFKNRTTVFHIGGIVREISATNLPPNDLIIEKNQLTGNL